MGRVEGDADGAPVLRTLAVPVGWGDAGWEDAYEAADRLLCQAKASGTGQIVIGGMLGTATQA